MYNSCVDFFVHLLATMKTSRILSRILNPMHVQCISLGHHQDLETFCSIYPHPTPGCKHAEEPRSETVLTVFGKALGQEYV